MIQAIQSNWETKKKETISTNSSNSKRIRQKTLTERDNKYNKSWMDST